MTPERYAQLNPPPVIVDPTTGQPVPGAGAPPGAGTGAAPGGRGGASPSKDEEPPVKKPAQKRIRR
jgi:hypothetical protein